MFRLFLILGLVVIAMAVLGYLFKSGKKFPALEDTEDEAIRTIRDRYAKGEISSKEYQEKITVLKGDSYHPENFD